MTAPYYVDDAVTLYLGDCRDVLPGLDVRAHSCVTDPPYGETSEDWDQWPEGWVAAVGLSLPASTSLWCFGTARMFLDRRDDFTGWRFAQEALWVKRNGTGPGSRDRLTRVHEWAYHWYRGRWSDVHHEWERERAAGPDKGHVRKRVRQAEHQRPGRENAWQDDGTRQPRSVRVIEAPSVRFQQRHRTEKPLAVVAELVRECTPPGGLVLDPFAGSGSTLDAARSLGRRAVGVEKDEAACEQIALRLSELVIA
jgi:site-specific DNA-methyltransferase (adenine-specific)